MQEMAGSLISTRGPNGPSYIVLEIAYRSAGNRQTTSFVRFRCDPETRINSRTFSSWYENAATLLARRRKERRNLDARSIDRVYF